MADLMEEIARIYGYDRIPETRLSDALPPQRGNPALQMEENLRDLLVNLGLQEVISQTLDQSRCRKSGKPAELQNRNGLRATGKPHRQRSHRVLRKNLLASLLNVGERNSRISSSLAMFEIGQEYHPQDGDILPQEPRKLVFLLSGSRSLPHWQANDQTSMDFYDMKGVVTGLLDGLHIGDVQYEKGQHGSFHPGKCAQVLVNDQPIGIFGEIHPQVKENYDFPEIPVLAAVLDVDAISSLVPDRYSIEVVPVFPPVLEDLAFVVDEGVQVQEIMDIIRAAGGKTVTNTTLFDVYRGGQAGQGKKSLAFSLTYQKPDRTLTDKEVSRIREKIIKQLNEKIGAQLRG